MPGTFPESAAPAAGPVAGWNRPWAEPGGARRSSPGSRTGSRRSACSPGTRLGCRTTGSPTVYALIASSRLYLALPGATRCHRVVRVAVDRGLVVRRPGRVPARRACRRSSRRRTSGCCRRSASRCRPRSCPGRTAAPRTARTSFRQLIPERSARCGTPAAARCSWPCRRRTSGCRGARRWSRVLPVDVEPVEDARRGARAAVAARRRDVALDEHVDAAGHELLPRGRSGGHVGEVLGVRPAAERQQDLQVRVLLLQLLKLVEVAGDGLVVDVGGAVDAGRGVERLLVVGERVPGAVTGVRVVLAGRVRVGGLGGLETGQVGGVDVLEVVDQVVELARRAGVIDVLEVVGVLVDGPLVVVGDLQAAGGRRGPGGVAAGVAAWSGGVPAPMAAEAPATMTAEASTAVRADLRDALIRYARSCGGRKET